MDEKKCSTCLHYDGHLCIRRAKREGVVLVGAQKIEVARSFGKLRIKECGKAGRFWTPKEG